MARRRFARADRCGHWWEDAPHQHPDWVGEPYSTTGRQVRGVGSLVSCPVCHEPGRVAEFEWREETADA